LFARWDVFAYWLLPPFDPCALHFSRPILLGSRRGPSLAPAPASSLCPSHRVLPRPTSLYPVGPYVAPFPRGRLYVAGPGLPLPWPPCLVGAVPLLAVLFLTHGPAGWLFLSSPLRAMRTPFSPRSGGGLPPLWDAVGNSPVCRLFRAPAGALFPPLPAPRLVLVVFSPLPASPRAPPFLPSAVTQTHQLLYLAHVPNFRPLWPCPRRCHSSSRLAIAASYASSSSRRRLTFPFLSPPGPPPLSCSSCPVGVLDLSLPGPLLAPWIALSSCTACL